MAVQYNVKATSITGGAGSGSVPKNDKGLIKTNLIGYKMEAKVLFQATGDPVPGNHSPFSGKSRTSDPNNELEIN